MHFFNSVATSLVLACSLSSTVLALPQPAADAKKACPKKFSIELKGSDGQSWYAIHSGDGRTATTTTAKEFASTWYFQDNKLYADGTDKPTFAHISRQYTDVTYQPFFMASKSAIKQNDPTDIRKFREVSVDYNKKDCTLTFNYEGWQNTARRPGGNHNWYLSKGPMPDTESGVTIQYGTTAQAYAVAAQA